MDHRLLWQRLALRFLLFAIGTTALFYLTPFIWRLLGPFILSFVIAAFLQPLIRVLKRARVPKSLSTLVLLLFLFSVILLLLYWFSSFVIEQAVTVLGNSSQWIGELQGMYMDLREWITTTFTNVQDLAQLDEIMTRLLAELTTWAGGAVRYITGATIRMAASLPSVLIFANFLLLGSFFLTRDYDTLTGCSGKDEPLSQSRQMMRSAAAAVGGYLRMQLIYTVFVLVVSVIGFTSFSIPYGFLISALAALLEFLPLFGNGTLYVPMILVCLILQDYRTALVTLGVHAILYITRKVTEPRVMKSQMGLPPILSLVSLYVGLQTGGVVGMTLAPILMVVAQEAWRSGFFDPAVKDAKEGLNVMWAFLRPDGEIRPRPAPSAPGKPGKQTPPARQKQQKAPRVRS